MSTHTVKPWRIYPIENGPFGRVGNDLSVHDTYWEADREMHRLATKHGRKATERFLRICGKSALTISNHGG